jgi:hypothetical protein
MVGVVEVCSHVPGDELASAFCGQTTVCGCHTRFHASILVKVPSPKSTSIVFAVLLWAEWIGACHMSDQNLARNLLQYCSRTYPGDGEHACRMSYLTLTSVEPVI